MRNIIIGNHYTYDNGNPLMKLIMFIIDKEKYIGEDVFYYDTISLNPNDEVFQKDFEVDFFESKFIRTSTKGEIKKLRSFCPIDVQWVNSKIAELCLKFWQTQLRPAVIFDPVEPLEKAFFGAYDSNSKTIIFRSEFLINVEIDMIEKYLSHELCHWYLHVMGEDFRDKDVRFAKEIIRLGLEETINIHNDEARKAYEEALL